MKLFLVPFKSVSNFKIIDICFYLDSKYIYDNIKDGCLTLILEIAEEDMVWSN
jgi:hypothetical protein